MLLPLGAHRQATADGALWWFVDGTDAAGLTSAHGYDVIQPTEPQKAAGGVAAGDFDNDGYTDLYVLAGTTGRNYLFRNQGDGTFVDVADAAGVGLTGVSGSGPLFFDYDGDGWLDLFVGAVNGDPPALFHNLGNGTFQDVTASSGLTFPSETLSATAGDYDGDSRLDLFVSHWGAAAGGCHLWHNDGGQGFSCADATAGLAGLIRDLTDRTFTANFVDLDGDGRPDLVVTEDFGQTTVWLNQGNGQFTNTTNAVISDQNGMGSAIGDYDGDGKLDWFVSSIRDADGVTEGNWGTTGNRLYRNRGDGTFDDVTDQAGVRDGDWGWGASFADFNNDGLLDLVHVNGWPQGSPQFRGTRARLFIAGPGGQFTDQAAALGFDERVGGRGVVCFDADGDGDLDIFVANNNGPHHLWRNDGGRAGGHYLDVRVLGTAPNPFAIGATVFVTAGGKQQVRDLHAGSNYVSQNPREVHFGLGASAHVDQVRVEWPDGHQLTLGGLDADRTLVVSPDQKDQIRGGGCSL
jgi:enediyne biosynthesis protein E4